MKIFVRLQLEARRESDPIEEVVAAKSIDVPADFTIPNAAVPTSRRPTKRRPAPNEKSNGDNAEKHQQKI